ncbi:hypothetical protein HNR00_004793 [Methylorubrum rhodinum]|uniref:Uncharacterized protein n=1 Tax=Methylorubrum rhodinum TaxID=29428 RepID=A0A840ZP69_9HYPH|nr:hypothetical protein [Methylorubrum rhodinum]MBB5760052.1 hypothetical protein [Methylorubrum rhodinum]
MGDSMVRATLADIAACFKLILGREPTPEEIGIHTKAHLGNDLADVLKSYLESDEFRSRNIVQIIRPQPDRMWTLTY